MNGFALLAGLGGDDPPSSWSLERLLTDPDAFGLTSASNAQLSFCRMADGRPGADIAPQIYGGPEAAAQLPRTRPAEMVLLAGIRGGKSLIAACSAVRAALTCDLSHLGPGEVPRVSVVSLSVDTARATWAHVRGRVEAGAALRPLLLEKPKADALILRHPSGRPVEIRVVAGSRAAGSLVARWSAGVIFDEAPRMLGQDDGVVNLDDARHAVRGRLLPGAQMFLLGSPWAPFGPVYSLVTERFGRPGADLVVCRATGPEMNPVWWTPERCEDLRLRDPDAYRVDVECGFLAPETSMFGLTELERAAVLPMQSEPEPRRHYVAAMDPATRGNAWTLVVLSRADDGAVEVVHAEQWIGSAVAPLSPRSVLQSIARVLRTYRCQQVTTDQWASDPLRDLAIPEQLHLDVQPITAPRRTEMFETLRALLADGKLRLPKNDILLRDLSVVRKRVTQQSIAIELPTTPDGRHADYAAALALAAGQFLAAPDPMPVVLTEREEIDKRKAEISARIAKAQRRGVLWMPR